MSLHVRHRRLPSPTRRAILSVSAVVSLCAVAIFAAQSRTYCVSAGTQVAPLYLEPWPEQHETTHHVNIEPPVLSHVAEPPPLYLVDTTPQLTAVDNEPGIDISELTEDFTPLIAAELSDTAAESRPERPAKSPAQQTQTVATYTPPQYVTAPQPAYPEQLRRRRISGTVRVRIHINAQGSPTAVDILSSPHPAFSQTAKRTILSSWRFSPARSGNTRIAASITTSVIFTLD